MLPPKLFHKESENIFTFFMNTVGGSLPCLLYLFYFFFYSLKKNHNIKIICKNNSSHSNVLMYH
jgi:hypothetical protein